MFEFDLSKMVLFGVVALVVVGPKELPAALRTAARVFAKLRGLRADVRRAADTLMAEASLDREFGSLSETMRTNLALDPSTAMRGNLPAAGVVRAEAEALEYASPEMQAYLAPAAEASALAEASASPT